LAPRTRSSRPKMRKPTAIWSNPQKKIQSFPIFFSIETRRLSGSLEGLNRSLALAAGELWQQMCLARSWLLRSLKEKGISKTLYCFHIVSRKLGRTRSKLSQRPFSKNRKTVFAERLNRRNKVSSTWYQGRNLREVRGMIIVVSKFSILASRNFQFFKSGLQPDLKLK